MTIRDESVVTGAFGYTGKHIAGRLLSMGRRVRTLTGHLGRPNPFGSSLSVSPLDFGDPSGLARGLEGATTLYNTYWIRFARGRVNFDHAVRNSLALIEAARDAGVRRLVHISITNASPGSPLPYFRGKGVVEEAIRRSGIPYSVLRPALVFGEGDVLVNNIAWGLRRFPAFPIFGPGDYYLRPIHVQDLARTAVDAGQAEGDETLDAVGPERLTFEEMLRTIAGAVGASPRMVHVSPLAGLAFTRVLGLWLRDVVLTRDEIQGLMTGLLDSPGPPTGETRLSEWVLANAGHVGTSYASEMERHYR